MGAVGKKRKLSDASIKDEDGDDTMHDVEDGEGPEVTSHSPGVSGGRNGADTSMMDVDEGNEGNQQSVTPKRSTRRRSAGNRKVAQQNEEQAGNESEEATTPKSNTRSSARQRKPPRRYEDTVVERRTPRSSRKNAATPSKEGRVTRSARRGAETPVAEDTNGDESPEPTATLSRRRSKRASVRFNTTETESTRDHDDEEQSEDEEHVQADSGIDEFADDLVAYQLQQGLAQNNVNGHEENTVTVEQLPDYAEKFKAICQDGLQEELRLFSGLVLEKLTGKRPVPLKGLESEYQKTHQLIEHTVSAGEGNSMLLLGSRGAGKTAMLETIVSSLRKKHKEDFHVVRLNGFLHTDDRLALREIWRQLGRETNTEDEAAKVNSYADTMATLLALLSHPEELFGPSENGEVIATAKSVIIILDEFDLFVSHPRQTLLYNLFDIAQARKAPLAVIGVTTKVDVTEMLEKRVKSRFSHRYVFLPLPRTFEMFSDVCYAGLGLEDDEITVATQGSDGAADRTEIAVLKSSGMRKLLCGWREYLKGLWEDKDFQHHLQTIYHQTKSPKELFTSALVPLSMMHHSTYQVSKDEDIDLEIPTPKSFTSHTLSCPDPAPLPFPPSSSISASTTPLPLSLLLAATRLTALHDPGSDAPHPQLLAPLAISFPAAYAEYVRLLTTAKASASASGATATPGRVWGRDIAREAWEKLAEWGVIVPVGGGANTADGRMFRIEVSFEEVVDMVGGGGALGRWWRDVS
ncbi:origin recognition complex subunit 4 [Paecilomyces lecythidis]|uniref:Origin recognition complex subunit 4 n=1 Tax=Paecilomyces lecythidis TaxID=3004212 RepID=A0ABR3YBJ9_9EURO